MISKALASTNKPYSFAEILEAKLTRTQFYTTQITLNQPKPKLTKTQIKLNLTHLKMGFVQGYTGTE